MNNLLSVCLSTYNRAEMLERCFKNLIPQLKKYDIPLYISDNGSKDNTIDIILRFSKTYKNLFFVKNETNIADANLARILKMSKSKFTWLFGDNYRIIDGAVDDIIEKLNHFDCVLLVMNTCEKKGFNGKKFKKRVTDKAQSLLFTDPNKLLCDLGWHMTMISSLVWSSELIKEGNYEKYVGTSFPHLGVIFEYLSRKGGSVYWLADPLVYSAKVKSSWESSVFGVFAKNWFELINGLPDSYPNKIKMKCIKDHGGKSGLFSFSGIIKLKLLGYYDFSAYKKYNFYLKHVTNIPMGVLLVIALFPMPSYLIGFLKRIRSLWDEKIKAKL